MALMNMDKLSGNKPKAQTSAEVPAASTESVETEYYASREAGQANIEHIPLDRIDLDPLNPRTKGMFDHRPLLAVIPRFLIINPKYKGYDAEKVRVLNEPAKPLNAKRIRGWVIQAAEIRVVMRR